ncbi:MAG: fumarylacetoacetate hydrolase family protein [Candidatus Caldarchaeum sp.]
MKIARIEHGRQQEYALVAKDGVYSMSYISKHIGESLPPTVAVFVEECVMDSAFRSMFEETVSSLPPEASLSRFKLLAPLDNRPKVICVGLNYRDHAQEQGVKPPEEPVIFMKPYTAITGPEHPIIYPKITSQLDYEAELAVVIGKRCKNVSKAEAREHILGYTCFNDVSARDIQFRDGQWVRGKSFDTFAPIGPWIVTADEVGDPQNLRIVARVNGEVRQESNTRNMIFDVYRLVEFISMVMTLEPGDVIATDTPSGVGFFYKPTPKLLRVGDVVEVEIEKIGVLANKVVDTP